MSISFYIVNIELQCTCVCLWPQFLSKFLHLIKEFRSALATNTKTVEQSEAVNYDYQQGDASPTEPVEEAGKCVK